MVSDKNLVSETSGIYHRAWYRASIERFLGDEPAKILGSIALLSEFDIVQEQRDAWLAQITLLRDHVRGLAGEVFLEFNIPRMGRRIDAVLIIGPILFVLEFKVGETGFDRADIEQVWDYALDLKNFHEASHSLAIIPVLIATEARSAEIKLEADTDGVYKPIRVARDQLSDALNMATGHVSGPKIDVERWATSSYRPTPTIVEAARALYARHSVEAIARFDAGAKNLRTTSARIEELVEQAQLERRKLICFVTGVPGAGKTLVGLNIATRKANPTEPTHAVFLSGNGPLVAVLRAALARDEFRRMQMAGKPITKGKATKGVEAFIQNVHHFRDEALIDRDAPAERVVIFDEAQRAWNLRQTANFMQRKKKRPGFNQSEPEFLVSYMDRHPDWSVVICLVGGGQEINTGEAGISAWLEAMRASFPGWHVHISDRLLDESTLV